MSVKLNERAVLEISHDDLAAIINESLPSFGLLSGMCVKDITEQEDVGVFTIALIPVQPEKQTR